MGAGESVIDRLRNKSVTKKLTNADWMLKAMIALAAADDRLNAREVGLIQRVYEEQAGRSVDASVVVLAVQTYATKRDAIAELSVAAGSMSQETKEEIVRAACLTLPADESISAGESKKLRAIAAALRISENRLEEILGGLEGDWDEERS